MTTTQTTSQSATQTHNMFDIVKSALQAKNRLPGSRSRLHRHDVGDFHLEARPGGWAAMIAFEDGRTGFPNSSAIPEIIHPTKQEAFLAGAETLCHILTGSKTLPFFVARGELIVAGYGTGGFDGNFMMKMPTPWS